MSVPDDLSLLANKIDLPLVDRGHAVASYIDLLDEGQYGAGNLAWRGRFDNLDTLSAVVNEVLALGSPIDTSESNVLSYNRFKCDNIHFASPLDFPETGNPYPYKALYMVHFRMRIKFLHDVAYIDFGRRWPRFRKKNGKLNKRYPFGPYSDGSSIPAGDLVLLNCRGISKQDSLIILKRLGFCKNVTLANSITEEDVIAGDINDRALDALINILQEDEDTVVLSTMVDGEETILHANGSILVASDT